MNSRRPPRLATALLEHFVPDNEPLTGDLLEDWPGRSDAWFWRQVLLAIVARTILQARTHPRVTAEATLAAAAMLTLLGFYAVVAANLMTRLLVLSYPDWIPGTGHYRAWQLCATVPSFAAAVLVARVVGQFHRGHRVAAVLAYSMSAMAAVFLNLYLFVPNLRLEPFVPDAALQIAVAMVFIAGLFVGIASRSRCESLPSS